MSLILVIIVICIVLLLFFSKFVESFSYPSTDFYISLAYLCFASYYVDDEKEMMMYVSKSKLNLSHIRTITNEQQETSAIIATDIINNIVYCAFAGTDINSYANIINDLDFVQTKVPDNLGVKGNISSGFLRAYTSLNDEISNYLSLFKPKNFIITGHSLGGAMAVLCSLYFYKGVDCSVVTFGCPKIGDDTFSQSFEQTGISCMQIANKEDIIPHTPFDFLDFIAPYSHLKQNFMITNDKGVVECQYDQPYVFPYNFLDWLQAHSLETYINLLERCPS